VEGCEGGLITLLSTDREIVRSTEEPTDERTRLYRAVRSARRYALGIDCQPQQKGIGVIKIQLGFDDEANCGQFLSALRSIIAKYAAEFDAALAKLTDDNEKAFAKTMLSALQNAKTETRNIDGAWQVDLQLAAPMDFLEMLKQL